MARAEQTHDIGEHTGDETGVTPRRRLPSGGTRVDVEHEEGCDTATRSTRRQSTSLSTS
jgi:hypothetical protein